MLKPNIWCVIIEESAFWAEDIQEKAGRLFGVYLVDKNVNTYLCEMAPSYYLEFVETVTDNEVSEETYEEICYWSSVEDQNAYYHCGVVDNAPLTDRAVLPQKDGMVAFQLFGPDKWTNETHEEAMEESLEYARCNSLA